MALGDEHGEQEEIDDLDGAENGAEQEGQANRDILLRVEVLRVKIQIEA